MDVDLLQSRANDLASLTQLGRACKRKIWIVWKALSCLLNSGHEHMIELRVCTRLTPYSILKKTKMRTHTVASVCMCLHLFLLAFHCLIFLLLIVLRLNCYLFFFSHLALCFFGISACFWPRFFGVPFLYASLLHFFQRGLLSSIKLHCQSPCHWPWPLLAATGCYALRLCFTSTRIQAPGTFLQTLCHCQSD